MGKPWKFLIVNKDGSFEEVTEPVFSITDVNTKGYYSIPKHKTRLLFSEGMSIEEMDKIVENFNSENEL